MPKSSTIDHILTYKLIVILRGYTVDEALRAVEAMAAGGVSLVEVTFDQTGRTPLTATTDTISAIAARFDSICVGAGTVMTAEQVALAAEAGAKYIISPDTCREVIGAAGEHGLVSIPGALTPTEAADAHRCGADFVKLFPAGDMGPAYLKTIAAPLAHIRFLAVGGVREENVGDYLAAGAVGIGIGAGTLAPKTLLAEGNCAEITRRAARYVELVR